MTAAFNRRVALRMGRKPNPAGRRDRGNAGHQARLWRTY